MKLWDASTGKELFTLEGHSDIVRTVAYSPDGKSIASGAGGDNTVRIWNPETGKEIVYLKGHSQEIIQVVYSPDSKLVASAGSDGIVKIWNIEPLFKKP